MSKKKRDFQQEIRLGLALIVLVLVVLNIAAHYTLFRVKQAVELQTKDELYEAAVTVARDIRDINLENMSSEKLSMIKAEYGLERLVIIPLKYEFVVAIHEGTLPAPLLPALDSTITAKDITPILTSQPIYRHRSGEKTSLLIFPARSAESNCIISVSKSGPLLSTLENATRILTFTGLLGILVIVYASWKFIRLITYPFKRLQEKAEKSGRLDPSLDDEVAQLLSSYERIISDLKEKEKELTRLNEVITRRADDLEVYNNYILKSISTGIITLDEKCDISTINRAAARILNLADGSLVGKPYTDVLGNRPVLSNIVKDFLNTGEAINSQKIQIAEENGKVLILSVSISDLTDSQGRSIGTSIILNDQTKFIKLQEELDLRRRMATLGEMSGGLAHQLRNSIAAIVGFAGLIDKKVEGDDSIRQNIRHLLKESMEAEELVSRFLDFARPLEIEPIQFEVSGMLDELIRSMKEKYPAVVFYKEYENRGTPFIFGDPLLLKQAIGNVVDNACKAIRGDNGAVKLAIEEAGSATEIRITDNGTGIPEAYREKIFTPFFSGSPSGSGLGLPLARKIVMLHKGRLEFDSTPGRGTTFRLILPSGCSPQQDSPSISRQAVIS